MQLGGVSECNAAKYPIEPKLKLSKDEGGDIVNATEFHRMIGSLRYLTHSQPDLAYLVGLISKYMEGPREAHLLAFKHILRYLKGTINYGLVYQKGGDGNVTG